LEGIEPHAPDAARIDAPLPEALDEHDPESTGVRRRVVEVCRDDAAEKIAEGDVDRRAVIDRADAHLQNPLGAGGRLARQTLRQVRVNLTIRQASRSLSGNPEQVG